MTPAPFPRAITLHLCARCGTPIELHKDPKKGGHPRAYCAPCALVAQREATNRRKRAWRARQRRKRKAELAAAARATGQLEFEEVNAG